MMNNSCYICKGVQQLMTRNTRDIDRTIFRIFETVQEKNTK